MLTDEFRGIKIGDKVRILDVGEGGLRLVGEVGRVRRVDSSDDLPYAVAVSENDEYGWWVQEVELVDQEVELVDQKESSSPALETESLARVLAWVSLSDQVKHEYLNRAAYIRKAIETEKLR